MNQPNKNDTNLNDPKVDAATGAPAVEPEIVQEIKSGKLPKNQMTMSQFLKESTVEKPYDENMMLRPVKGPTIGT